MYIVKEGKMSKDEFIDECLERAFCKASVPIDLPHHEFIVFDNKRYTENGKMMSKIAIKEIGSAYTKTLHIVKHIFQPESEIFYEEEVQLNSDQILAIQNMDKILSEKPKPSFRIVK